MNPHPRTIGSSSDNDRRKRDSRTCNCKRSNCLKLYCECFANGFYCNAGRCHCINCHNNFENEPIRRDAIEYTLERNPAAFRSKIVPAEAANGAASSSSSSATAAADSSGLVRTQSQSHHKGCHCKKSNCLKKYCECFQANIICTNRCRCFDCKNYADSVHRAKALSRQQRDVGAPTDATTANTTGPITAASMSAADQRESSAVAAMLLSSSGIVVDQAFVRNQSQQQYDLMVEKIISASKSSDSQQKQAHKDEEDEEEGEAQARKKARVAAELSRCLDIIIDHSNSLLPPSLHISSEYLSSIRPNRAVKSLSQLQGIGTATNAFLPNISLFEAGNIAWPAVPTINSSSFGQSLDNETHRE